MKRHLLFAMLCIVGALNVSAQSWTASAVGDGYALLYNVGTGKFLTRGNGWGTQASVGTDGLTINLQNVGDNKYKMVTNIQGDGNGYENLNGGTVYSDQSRGKQSSWDFIQVGTDNGPVYNIVSADNHGGGSGAYLYAQGEGTIVGPGSDGTIDNAKWKVYLFSDQKEKVLAAMPNATTSTPVDATVLIGNPNFTTSLSNNAASAVGTNWTMNANNQNLSGGDLNNPCAESWHSTFTLSQTISVPNGYYKVRGQGFYRQDGSDNDNLPYFYVNDKKVTFPLKTGSENSMSDASGSFTAGQYTTEWSELAEVTTREITVGAELKTNTNLWCIWDNIQLMYYGPLDLSSYVTGLNAIVQQAAGYENQIPSAAYAALQDVVSENNGTYDNADDYDTAIANIQDAINTYASSDMLSAYAEYKDLVSQVNALKNVAVTSETEAAKTTNTSALESAMGTINTNVEAVTTDASAITSQFASIKDAAKTYVTGLIPNDPDNAPFDITLLIVNPNIDGNANGWTIERPVNGNGPLLNNSAFEYWSYTAGSGGFDYHQTIENLPNGFYRVSAQMYNDQVHKEGDTFAPAAGVYGTGDSGTIMALVTVQGTELNPYTTEDIAVVNGNLRIGIKNETEVMPARWFVADNFKLYFIGTPDEISPYIAAWQAALATARATAASTDKKADWVQTSLEGVIDDNDEDAVDQSSIVALVAATNALIAANELGQKSIHSYKVIAQGFVPDNSLEGWVCENDNTFHINTWSGEGNEDGSDMTTPFIENWVGKGSYLGEGKVYYKLEGLEPGEVYSVEALVRSYNEANSDAPNGPNFYINNTMTDLTNDGTTFTYNEMSGIYATLSGEAVIGEDGVLEFGVVIDENRNYNWVAFKNIKIHFNVEINETKEWDATTACVGKVTLTRAISATNINTLVLPFSMTADEVATYFGEGSKVYVVGSYANDNIVLSAKTSEDETWISANEPVLLKATKASEAGTSYEIPARTIVATEDPSTTTGDVKFVGVYTFNNDNQTRFVVPEGRYIVSNNEFRHVEKEGTAVLKSTRAYFTVEGTDGVKALSFSFDDSEATGIATIEDGQLNILTGKVYDLSGREVKNPTKGLYIIDGRKVMIK